MLYDTHYRHNEALSPEALGTLPAETQIVYSVTADRSVYALDLVGGTFGGAVHYDSAAGVVSTR